MAVTPEVGTATSLTGRITIVCTRATATGMVSEVTIRDMAGLIGTGITTTAMAGKGMGDTGMVGMASISTHPTLACALGGS